MWKIVILLAVASVDCLTNYSYVVNTFNENDNHVKLTHMVRDRQTGNLFVAGHDTLYEFNESLLRLRRRILGPKKDSASCFPQTLRTACNSLQLTNVIPKAIAINKGADRLIMCRNIYHGSCENILLSNINFGENNDPEPPMVGLENIVPNIVPNDEQSSSVIILAPGKTPNQNVLYVGAETPQRTSIYGSDWTSVSTRQADNFGFVLQDSLQGFSRQKLTTHQFKIKYVFGFSHVGYTYFLVTQKASTESDSPIITKLVRVCQKDNKYQSYAEIPLECSNGALKYNHAQTAYLTKPGSKLFSNLGMNTATNMKALFVLFSADGDGSSRTAMCVYSIWDIISKFTENIRQCFNGNGMTGPSHFTFQRPCIKIDTSVFGPINDDYCGDYDLNSPIGTNGWPLSSTAVITWTESVTAIAVTATYNYTVAFIGTSKGNLKKVVVETKNSATQYSEIPIHPGHAILPDLVFGEQSKYLYVLTDKKVTRIKVEECQQYTGCNACIMKAKDPYCGWCTLESRCSIHGQCANSDLQMHWLPYNNEKCTEITFVSPNMSQIENDRQNLNINIQNLPTVTGANYQCAFYMREGSQPLLTDGVKTINGIQCLTPPREDLPNIPTGMDHITMQLAVRTNGQDFVATNFSFFNCALHSSCTSCTQSKFPCTFCVRKHKCTHNREHCGSDVMVTGVSVPGISDRSGPEYCPKIKSQKNKITVASGYQKAVTVEASNLQSVDIPFKCKFTMLDGNVVTRIAVKQDNRIDCETMIFSYSTSAATHLIPFQVTWGPNEYPLDNPSNIQVQIYKCQALAASGGQANCGNCLTLESDYNCGWCREASSCLVQQECSQQNTWLMQTSNCPDPEITSISPSSGPLMGGTMVTIYGINLGKNQGDVTNGVTVAGVPCIVEEYVKTAKIVCKTGRSMSSRNDIVTVKIAGMYTAKSKTKFRYVVPSFEDFKPKKGIQAGGTRVTITGRHLNAGTTATVTFGLEPCAIQSTSETEAVCITSPVAQARDARLEMTFDLQIVRNSDVPRFQYVKNPNITSFGRGKGFKMGGLMESVYGTNFLAVQTPKMLVLYAGTRYYGTCTVETDIRLSCVSPSLTNTVNKRATTSGEAQYGYKMENLEVMSNQLFQLYTNPTFVQFQDGRLTISKKIETLKIQGNNLAPALTKNDISVNVGSSACVVTLLVPATERDKETTDEIHCTLPEIEDGVTEYGVEVVIGANTNQTHPVGTLIYEDEDVLPLWAKILLGAIGAVFIIVIIVVIIMYKRKSKENVKQVQHMQHQMDVLETKVAKECKEAFAELQTDMTEMTSDLTGLIGMPFLDYRSFSMRVLFPNCSEYDHPVVKDLEVDFNYQENLERGLRQFGQLMGNKTFLLLFIRTLESNPKFSMRERVNVASLVSVALQGKMEYMTDILKTLLAELIEKSVEGKSHPKLLLRRTESVAEKMLTNWFTFLLFKFLKECAGEPLFMLFRAIKQQVEKGPIDAVSGEAKYSLSEDKLIRHAVEYKTLTIYVIETEEAYSAQQHPVRVLDVDNISQVKEKILDAIYKNAPFSSRHCKEDLDLEWHTGAQGRIILQDEDKSTKSEEMGLKRLNTLQHYGVTDNATMALITKQPQYNHSMLSDKSGRSREFDNTYMTSSPSMSRILSPNSSSLDVEGGSKLYHLVKPHDSDIQKEGERGSKMVSEIYLTRLLATKGTLQQFVDDLFETIFSTAHRGSALPLAIKYMFDFLDDQALLHGITDPETVHTWKSNSLPLRFWVNVIKNPNFVFDVYKSSIVDSCLSVVAQTFMDSCSMSDHRLGKDSPATKLLYAKDIPKYKKWVERYYQDIKLMPAISDQDMNALLAEESRMHQSEFNSMAALNELYKYTIKYNDQLLQTLEEDEFARKNRLSHRLEQVHMNMETQV